MSNPTQPNGLTKELIVLLLAIAGGSVDAMMIVGFGVLTAAQTGNTILLGVALAQGRFTTGLYSGISIACFVIGAAQGEMIDLAGRDADSGMSSVRRMLLAELVPLIALLILWSATGRSPAPATSAVFVALGAAAMGIQSAAALRLNARTTYITGTVMKFTTRAIRHLHPIHTEVPPKPEPHQSESAEGVFLSPAHPWIYGMRWLIYAAGALAGGLLFSSFGGLVVCLPIVAIVVVIALSRIA